MQVRAHRGMPALSDRRADLSYAQVEPREHGIEEQRFSHTAWSGQYRDTPVESEQERIESEASLDAGEMHGVARRGVVRKPGFCGFLGHEVDLVHHDAG